METPHCTELTPTNPNLRSCTRPHAAHRDVKANTIVKACPSDYENDYGGWMLVEYVPTTPALPRRQPTAR